MAVMVGTQTTTTTTVTSNVATPAATVGPVYPSYTGYAPSTGLASAPPLRPAVAASQYLPTLIDTMEVSPEAWTGPAGHRAKFEDQDLEAVWVVIQVLASTSGQLPAMASTPSLVGLGLLVEPPVVPWNMQCSTGSIGTITRASSLVLFTIRNQSPMIAMVQGLIWQVWPVRLRLSGCQLDQQSCTSVLEYCHRIPASPRLGMGNLPSSDRFVSHD